MEDAVPPSDTESDVRPAISPETVCYLVVKAKEYFVKDAVTEPNPGSNPTDDNETAVLEDHRDDPVRQELIALIDALNEDEQVDLVALAWLGRDADGIEDWPDIRQEAMRAHNDRTASYLLGMPLLADYLEEGLSLFGFSCEEFETGRL
jgi:hypothetical protein